MAPSWRVRLAVGAVLGVSACSSQPAEVATVVATSLSPLVAPPPPPHPMRIVAVTPERLVLDGPRVAPQTLEVAYVIEDTSSVTSARLELEIRDFVVLARMDVPVQNAGTVRFVVDPRAHVLGAVVRFRATCPGGRSEWFAMGRRERTERERDSSTVRIDTVSPSSIAPSPDQQARADATSGQRVSITGTGLTAACAIDTEVDGVPAGLANARFDGRRFGGLLRHRDINYGYVTPRFAELRLRVSRGKIGVGGMIVSLPFVE